MADFDPATPMDDRRFWNDFLIGASVGSAVLTAFGAVLAATIAPGAVNMAAGAGIASVVFAAGALLTIGGRRA